MVGYAFMGAAHSQAWRTAPRFFDLPVRLRMSVLAGRDEGRAQAAAGKYGWDDVETDWARLVARDDVDIVDICAPGDTHAEIAIAALAAGKHVMCEKPLANSVAEAQAMAEAARAATRRGVRAMCGFTYRRVPAVRLMADLVASGAIGTLRHIRASYLRLNELLVYDATEKNPGFRTVLVTEPSHPYIAAWWPPGHTLGYEHAFTHQVRDFVEGITSGQDVHPTFDDALGVQRVLAAVEQSAGEGGGWVDVDA
jgi:predicted dehydrogenase